MQLHAGALSRKALEAMSDLAGCHYKLLVLTGLLEACGENMEPWLVNGAGSLAREQVGRLEQLMTILDRETRTKART